MAQGLLGGVTSYDGQSLNDILDDIKHWNAYTRDIKKKISDNHKKLIEVDFWRKIPFNFQMTILSSLKIFDTYITDFEIINKAISNEQISYREVKLLRKIGQNSIDFNHEYGKTFKEEYSWREYGNIDFQLAEEIYQEGRDFFVTLQDAKNAAHRMEDYMNHSSVQNQVNVSGNNNNLQVQQGNNNVIMNHRMDVSKLEQLIKEIYSNLEDGISKEVVEEINEYVDVIKEEVTKPTPKRNLLKTALSGLRAIKGSAEFAAAVSAIVEFVQLMMQP